MPIQMLMISMAVGSSVGVNSLISRRLGAKRFDEANKAQLPTPDVIRHPRPMEPGLSSHEAFRLSSATIQFKIYKGTVVYQIEMQGEVFKISPTKELERYIEQLNCYTEPLKVWSDIKQMIH